MMLHVESGVLACLQPFKQAEVGHSYRMISPGQQPLLGSFLYPLLLYFNIPNTPALSFTIYLLE
jgi:hypothetical protein